MNRFITIALFALAIAPLASTAAQADTIYLQCSSVGLLAVDLTANTVNGTKATITPIAIDWVNANQYGEVHLHIDRTAGTISISGVYHRPEGDVPIPQDAPQNCTKQNAPATKF